MPFSNGGGGTLTLPSPTHVHNVDVTATVRSLRRSLSRSPSKFRLSGLTSPAPQNPPATTQLSQTLGQATAAAPSTPAFAAGPFTPIANSAPPQLHATTATPFRPNNLKLSVRSTRPKTVNRPLSRTRLSPKSPLKRVFGPSPDSGNQLPPSSAAEVQGLENASIPDVSAAVSTPATRRSFERPSRLAHPDSSSTTKLGLFKLPEPKGDPFPSISVSPMKRSEGVVGHGEPSSGSPVAKRRSLHGIAAAANDLSVFDQPPMLPQGFEIHDDSNREYQLTGSSTSPVDDVPASPASASVPKRTSSLRRSTLQQRHGTSQASMGRRAGERQLALFATEPGTPVPAPRSRPRLSLDQYVPPDERPSLFSQAQQSASRPISQPHPLSRVVQPSSESSSRMDGEFPAQRPLLPQVLSRSLPPGSRPPLDDSEGTSTPDYKGAKPLQSAFRSTGLVSKMKGKGDDAFDLPSAKVAPMPDTPCKKQPYYSATYPPRSGGGSSGRRRRISLGSPSSPFSAVAPPVRGDLFGTQDKPGNRLFKQLRAGHARQGSMLSLDCEEAIDTTEASESLPPTPTKNLFTKSHTTPAEDVATPDDNRSFAARSRLFAPGTGLRATNAQAKLALDTQPDDPVNPLDAISRPSTPYTSESPCVGLSFAARAESGAHPALFATPAPVRTSTGLFMARNRASQRRTSIGLSPTEAETPGPHTPQETVGGSMTPPDPSSLSISNPPDTRNSASHTPATPSHTQSRSLFSSLASRRASITPQNAHVPTDVDESLVARFDKAEVIGHGEFSQVYRVVKASAPFSFMLGYSTTPRTPSSPRSEQVYAVKRLKMPFHGAKGRKARLREVSILQSLRHSSKVVQLIDSWEHQGHLYIQTEFCAEGNLAVFLKTVGERGRLDDFRIWKILLETAQGLAAIHEAGFIHLDIKPANILITFDGYLKIGDFGLATSWPAAKGIEGEGDRAYLAPEILNGQYDKPADVFSLGLMILEVACNVFLPENGAAWSALRVADFSGVPYLTSGEAGALARDANGLPLDNDSGVDITSDSSFFGSMTYDAKNLFGAPKRAELQRPPSFMLDPLDPNSLDNLILWILQPNPADRPTAEQILAFESVAWISARRAAGATVFEGNWGPQVGPSGAEELVDTEMTDA
ncbi:hypothetical protein VTJ83DRAFT_3977 [Remersonia thermophila]|uniref:Protein kinase domain-containing protein n=1 Tax=Remersonia thermophila TaxID=72144 RepID=A0ABR4DFK4_9PEZI